MLIFLRVKIDLKTINSANIVHNEASHLLVNFLTNKRGTTIIPKTLPTWYVCLKKDDPVTMLLYLSAFEA